jgi:hypothetical protein
MNWKGSNPASARQLSPWLALLTLFLFSRLYNLTLFPIFSDEAIYIHWAQIVSGDINELFISKTGDKPPLHSWLNALTLPLFNDPLVSGRIVSVVSGLFSMVGIIVIGNKYIKKGTGWVAGVLYVFCPYTLHLDRMAMMESLLTSLGVWIVYMSLKISESKTIKFSWFFHLGILMGLAFYTKMTALLLFPVLIYIFMENKKWKETKFIIAFFCSLLMAFIIVLPLLFSHQKPFHLAGQTLFDSQNYYIPLEIIFSFPWQIWLRNLGVIADLYSTYITFPVLLISIVSITYIWKERDNRGRMLLFWAVIPIVSVLLIANSFYSRYFLLAVPPVLLLAARGYQHLVNYISLKYKSFKAGQVSNKGFIPVIGVALLLLVLSDSLNFSYKLLRDPANAPFSKLDRLLYVEGMPSGFGLKLAVNFLAEKSKETPITLLITDDLGNPQEGLSVYLWGNERIKVISAPWWPESGKLIPDSETFPLLASKHQKTPMRQEPVEKLKNVFFLYPFTTYPESRFLKENPNFEKVWTYTHLNGNDSITIFKLKT